MTHACAGLDPALFFPEGSPADVRSHTRRVIDTICRPCDERALCLARTLKLEQTGNNAHGIAGGMSPRQRRVLTSKQRDALIQAGAA